MKRFEAYFNNFFWLFLTFFSAPYLYLRIFLRKKNIKVARILIIQRAAIGDLVCTTHIFREIKKRFPSCHISALVTDRTKGILINNPRLEEVISINDFKGFWGRIKLISKIRRKEYDWVFTVLPDSFNNVIGLWSLIPDRAATTYRGAGEVTDFTSVFNNHRLEYLRHTSVPKHYTNLLKFIGIEECSEEREIFTTEEEEKKARVFLQEHNLNVNDLLIGISVVAGVKLIEWIPERWAELADKLIENLGAKIIFTGAPDDKKTLEGVQEMMRNKAVNGADCFELHEVAALMRKLKLFISVDSGPVFIADAVKTPTVAIVGPSDIDMREQPLSFKQHKMIQKDLPCRPCSFVFVGERVCREGHIRCLRHVTVEEVFLACQELITKQK